MDLLVEGTSVFSDSESIIQNYYNLASTDPALRLESLYQYYMNDSSLFNNYSNSQKDTLVKSSLSIAGAYLIGGCEIASNVAIGNLKTAAIGFTIQTYTDFFNYVNWLALRYGYSGRFAMRFMDYSGM